MNTNDLLKSLYPISVRRDVCLKDYCRYKTGGNAAAMVFPKTADELKRAVTALKTSSLSVIFCLLLSYFTEN